MRTATVPAAFPAGSTGAMPENFVVTTGITAGPETVSAASEISAELGVAVVSRNGLGIKRILAQCGAGFVLVVQADRLMLSDGDASYSYHPNMLLVRGLNVLRGWRDVFLDAAELCAGECVLDCTVGFGCEASLAALAVGPAGRVVGLESQPALAVVTRTGLAAFELETPALRDAMRRVEVVTADYAAFLRDAPERSFDVVAFDPFFDERVEGSEHSVSPLVRFGNGRPLDVEAVKRARCVARRRVVVKHPRYVPLPGDLAALCAREINSRKGPTAYAVFDPA